MIEVSLPRSASRNIARKQAKAIALPSYWPLVLVLAVQTIISLVTLHNTAFQDEGLYLYAGRILARYYWMGGPASLDRFAYYFSGYPGFYPLIGGILDMIGGLELARDFSLLCMLGVNIIVYLITKRLFQRSAAIFASATYASLGTVLFLGRLATYDPLCLFLIALAVAFAFKAGIERRPWLALPVGPFIALSILAKYAAILFAPSVLAILILCSIAFQGWWRMALNLVLSLVTLALSLAVIYHFMDKLAFHAIVGSTLNRTPLIEKTRLELFLHVLYMGGIVYAAASLGLVLVFFRYKRLLLIALLIFGSSWLVPAYHIYKQEAVSLDKHMAFTLFFAMPLAGYTLSLLADVMQKTSSHAARHYWLAGLSVVLIVFTLGMQQSQTLYTGWANTTGLSYALHTQLRDGSGRVLAEDIEVARYDTRDITEQWQWNGVSFFYYVNAHHQALLGDPALQQAIQDRYFAIIELSFIYQPAEANFITHQMIATRNYDLIDKIQFQNSYGIGYFFLFRSAAVAGHGNFTKLSQVKF